MNAVPEWLMGFLAWLRQSSLQAAVLVVIIMAVQMIFHDRLAPRWRCALWMVLLVRLVLPWAPASTVSLYNWIPLGRPVAERALPVPPAVVRPTLRAQPLPVDPLPRSLGLPAAVVSTPRPSAGAPTVSDEAVSWRFRDVLVAGWLTGVFVRLALLVWQTLRCVGLGRRRPVTEQKVLDLLEDCKELMGVSMYLAVVETPGVKSPSLFGFLRPRLLLPPGAVESLGSNRLRHVFLHELAHVKRYDIAISWLMAALQILHWFNPFVWYAFYRIRAERELACDELAMARLAGDASDYGRTIVCLLERFAQPRALPNLAGILEDKKQMKRRIAMISQFHPGTGSRWILAAALLAGLAAVALTNAKGPESSPSAKAPEAVRQFDRAEKAFREALSAPAADRTRKFTEVLELYKTVHAKYSGNKDLAENSLVGMGLCYDGLGNTTEAAKALETAVKVIGFSGTWYHLGVMREKLGQKDLADAAFLKCVVIDLRQKGNLDGFPLKNALEKIKGQAEKLKLLDHGSVVRAYNLQARLIDNYGSIRDLHYTVTTEYEEPNASRNSVEEVWVKFPANGTPAPNPLFPIKVRRGAVYKDMEVRQNNETIKGFQSREILAGGVVRSTLWPASAPDRTDTETMPVEKRIGRWELFDSVLLYDYFSAQSQTSGRIDLWSERGILTVDEKALRPVKLVSFRPEKGLELEQEITEFHEYPDRKFAFPKTIRVKLYQPGQVTPHAVGVRRVTNLKINSDLPDSLFDPTH